MQMSFQDIDAKKLIWTIHEKKLSDDSSCKNNKKHK